MGEHRKATARRVLVCRGPTGFGFTLAAQEGGQGVNIARVIPGGQAQKSGVKVNDKIFAINGKSPRSVEAAVQLIKEAEGSLILMVGREEPGDIMVPLNDVDTSWKEEARGRSRSMERNTDLGRSRSADRGHTRAPGHQQAARSPGAHRRTGSRSRLGFHPQANSNTDTSSGQRSQHPVEAEVNQRQFEAQRSQSRMEAQRSHPQVEAQRSHPQPEVQRSNPQFKMQRSQTQVEIHRSPQQMDTKLESQKSHPRLKAISSSGSSSSCSSREEPKQSPGFSCSAAQLQMLLQVDPATSSLSGSTSSLSGHTARDRSSRHRSGESTQGQERVVPITLLPAGKENPRTEISPVESVRSQETGAAVSQLLTELDKPLVEPRVTVMIEEIKETKTSTTKTTERLRSQSPGGRSRYKSTTSLNELITDSSSETKLRQVEENYSKEIANIRQLYTDEIETLKKTVNGLNKQNVKLVTSIEDKTNENNRLNGDFEKKLMHIEENHTREIANLRQIYTDEIETLKKLVDKKNKELETVNDENKKLKGELETSHKNVANVNEELKEARQLLANETSLRSDIEMNSSATKDELTRKIKALNKELEEKETRERESVATAECKRQEYEERLKNAVDELRDMYEKKMVENREEFKRKYKARVEQLQSKAPEKPTEGTESSKGVESLESRVARVARVRARARVEKLQSTKEQEEPSKEPREAAKVAEESSKEMEESLASRVASLEVASSEVCRRVGQLGERLEGASGDQSTEKEAEAQRRREELGQLLRQLQAALAAESQALAGSSEGGTVFQRLMEEQEQKLASRPSSVMS